MAAAPEVASAAVEHAPAPAPQAAASETVPAPQAAAPDAAAARPISQAAASVTAFEAVTAVSAPNAGDAAAVPATAVGSAATAPATESVPGPTATPMTGAAISAIPELATTATVTTSQLPTVADPAASRVADTAVTSARVPAAGAAPVPVAAAVAGPALASTPIESTMAVHAAAHGASAESVPSLAAGLPSTPVPAEAGERASLPTRQLTIGATRDMSFGSAEAHGVSTPVSTPVPPIGTGALHTPVAEAGEPSSSAFPPMGPPPVPYENNFIVNNKPLVNAQDAPRYEAPIPSSPSRVARLGANSSSITIVEMHSPTRGGSPGPHEHLAGPMGRASSARRWRGAKVGVSAARAIMDIPRVRSARRTGPGGFSATPPQDVRLAYDTPYDL